MSKLFTTILPSLLAGGLLFGSALTGAQPAPPAPPAPPTAATPPRPPKAPKPPKAPAVKIKGDIHIDLDEIDQMVDEQIGNALEAIGESDDMPPQMREAAKARLEKIRIKVKKRISKISPTDLEHLGEELGKMGDELGEDMEQFGKEMEKFGHDLEKDMAKKLAKQMKDKKVFVWKGPQDWAGSHDDDDFDDDAIGDFDDDDDDLDALQDLGSLGLDQAQRTKLRVLRTQSDIDVKAAKQQLDRASEALRRQLESGSDDVAQIERAIDDVTKAEAQIRKARIVTWVKARKLLDASQRKKIEGARKSR